MNTVRDLIARVPAVHKLLVVVAGFVVQAVFRRYGVDSVVSHDVVWVLTAAGVYQARNA